MFSLNDSPLSTIVNALDEDRYTVTEGGFPNAESYIVTDDATGIRVRIQAEEGDPDSLNLCGEDTEGDDWGDLSADPAKGLAQIESFATWLAARKDR